MKASVEGVFAFLQIIVISHAMKLLYTRKRPILEGRTLSLTLRGLENEALSEIEIKSRSFKASLT